MSNRAHEVDGADRHQSPVDRVPDDRLDTTGVDDTRVADDHGTTGDVTTGHAEHRGTPATKKSGGKLGSAWVALVLGALITIVLLVFIVQNGEKVTTKFFNLQFELPLGVLLLFAAIAGALIMAMFAGVRILQLRMRARKDRRAYQGR